MIGRRAALRYAKAILAYAEENNSSGALAKDMNQIKELLNENKILQMALENPLLVIEKKKSIINELLPNACEESRKLLALLAQNNRLSLLGETSKKFLSLLEESKGEIKAVVTSAVPLSPDLEIKVLEKAKQYSNKKVHIVNKVDPNILGGFILKIGDMQYDASVLHKLKVFKTKLTKTNTI